MNQGKLKNLIASIPTEQLKSDEIEPFIQQMRNLLIAQALWGEMDAHLGYGRSAAPIVEMTPVRRR